VLALKRVAVLMGGVSSEHPVSLASGCGILGNLDPNRYLGFPVLISRDHRWLWPREIGSVTQALNPTQAEELLRNPPADWEQIEFPRFTNFPQAEIFFLGLHGVGGEDGRLQGFLEMANQPFTGSGSLGSALAMDKILSKQLYAHHGIPTSPWVVLSPDEYNEAGADRVQREIGIPAVVKHPTGGSSIGVAIAKDRESLLSAFAKIGSETPRLLVEKFLPGREASCGVLEGVILSPTEIRPKQDGYFSFAAKYEKGRTEEITPAGFPKNILEEMQGLARRCHDALQLSVYSRTDFIWTESGVFALETNNLPGFTPQSLLPQQAAHAGLSYRDLVTRVIEESLRRWRAP
jgi:D-alanine-D-alanine ligase